MGQWKMNVARGRKAGGAREHSTWFDGAYHQPASFRTVVFGAEGVIQNGGFEDVITLDTPALVKRYGRAGWRYGHTPPQLPRRWFLHGGHPGTATVVTDGAHAGRRAWKVDGGWVQQSMAGRIPPNATLRIAFWARGTGTLKVALYQYKTTAAGKRTFHRTEMVGTVKLAPAWRRHLVSYKHAPSDPPAASLAFWVTGSATLDDVSVRIEEAPK